MASSPKSWLFNNDLQVEGYATLTSQAVESITTKQKKQEIWNFNFRCWRFPKSLDDWLRSFLFFLDSSARWECPHRRRAFAILSWSIPNWWIPAVVAVDLSWTRSRISRSLDSLINDNLLRLHFLQWISFDFFCTVSRSFLPNFHLHTVARWISITSEIQSARERGVNKSRFYFGYKKFILGYWIWCDEIYISARWWGQMRCNSRICHDL